MRLPQSFREFWEKFSFYLFPTYIQILVKQEIILKMTNKLSLYSDYIHDFGNIDFDWELNFDLTINKYIKANVRSHFIYDDDIKTKTDVDSEGNFEIKGARIQLKQLLGVGLSYSF